jgi:hypothetical protein
VGGGFSTAAAFGGEDNFASGNVLHNKVTITGGTINGSVYGGVSQTTGNAEGNIVNIQGTASITGEINGGMAQDAKGNGNTTGNTVTIAVTNGGTIGGKVVGGKTRGSGKAESNTVTIAVTNGGTIVGEVIGGKAEGGGNAGGDEKSAGNTVIISNTGSTALTLDGEIDVKGGSAESSSKGDASNNSVTISGNVRQATSARSVMGGYSKAGSANSNTVILDGYQQTDGDGNLLSNGYVFGGLVEDGSGTATNNTVIIDGNTKVVNVYGGENKKGTGDFTGNTLTKLSEASTLATARNFENVNFGYSGEANIGKLFATADQDVNLNTNAYDVIFNGTITTTGTGKISKTGAGTLTLRGVMSALSNEFNVNAGRAILEGANVSGVSGGGVLGSGTSGSVNVASGAAFELRGNASVAKDVDLNTGAILTVNTTGNAANQHASIGGKLDAGGATVQFVIDNPANYTALANSVLHVQTATFDNASNVEIYTGVPLGDTLSLINATTENGVTNLDQASLYIQSGFGTQYEVTITDGQLNLTPKSAEQTQALSEGFLGGVGVLNLGGDLLVDKGVANAVRGVGRGGAGEAFAALGGGKIKHKTGSHVDVSGTSLVAGVAAGVGSGATVGGFVEYGDGDYDSSNSFTRVGKVKGQGDADYYGVGLLGRLDLAGTANGQAYLEATARVGRIKNEFRSKDFRALGQNRRAEYDVRSNYYGASLGGGYVLNLGAERAVDVYGRYVWTRQAGDSARLTGFNERLKFDAVDSHRLRVGARYSASWSANSRFYAGAAWEHEFDGQADASINGRKIDSPDMKGSSGIAEFGWMLTPTDNKNLSIDLGLQGYGGKRQGATGSAQLRYAF